MSLPDLYNGDDGRCETNFVVPLRVALPRTLLCKIYVSTRPNKMPLADSRHERSLRSLITGEFEKIQRLDRTGPEDDHVYHLAVKKISETLRKPKHAGWRTLPDLVSLVRTLYRQEWLQAGGKTPQVTILCELLVTHRPGSDGRPTVTQFSCGALLANGDRCKAPLPDGRFVCPQHESQGLRSIVKDRDEVRPLPEPVPTTLCYSCHREYTDHLHPEKTVACDLCHATVYGECLDAYYSNDDERFDPHHCVICDYRKEHRRSGLLLVTHGTDEETGDPCEPPRLDISAFTPREISQLRGGKRKRNSDGSGRDSQGPRRRPEPEADAEDSDDPGEAGDGDDGPADPGRTAPGNPDILRSINAKLQALTALVEKGQHRQDVFEQRLKERDVLDRDGRDHAGKDTVPPTPNALSVWGDGPLIPGGITGAGSLTVTSPPQTPTPPKNFARAFTANPVEFQGKKENQDQAGRVASHPRHIFNKHVVSSFDYMGNIAESDAAQFRSQLRFTWSPSDSKPPLRRDLEDYWRQCLDYLWAVLHHPDCDVHTVVGREREYRVLVIIARIKYIKANCDALSDVAAEYGSGHTSWSDVHKLLSDSVKLDFTRPGVLLFDSIFWDRLVLALCQDTRLRAKPHFSDQMQEQLYHLRYREARRLVPVSPPVAPPSLDRAPREGPTTRAQTPAKGPGTPACGLCLSTAHTFKDHPSNVPITVPCRKCGTLHAMNGPLRTPCPQGHAEEAPRSRNPRHRDSSPDRHQAPTPPSSP